MTPPRPGTPSRSDEIGYGSPAMLATRELRPLTLTNATPGRPPHLSAGSGLIRRGDHIYVVGDDELDLAVFRRGDDGPGELVRLFEGALPLEGRERSSAKPDLEAVTVIPPFRFHPHGALLALGSGSKDSRERGFVWSLDEDGALRGLPRVIDVSPLYDFVRRHIEGRLNIERSRSRRGTCASSSAATAWAPRTWSCGSRSTRS